MGTSVEISVKYLLGRCLNDVHCNFCIENLVDHRHEVYDGVLGYCLE